MKRILYMAAAALAFACLASTSSAQEGRRRGQPWQERVKTEKIAYLTDALELTPAEAEKFWPVYNRAEAEKKESFEAVLEAHKALDEALKAEKSDGEISPLLESYLSALQSGTSIDEKYAAQYKQILPVKKVAKLFISEETFRRQQIRRLHVGGKGRN